MYQVPFIKRFSLNTRGRDLIVGDIHGCFSHLQAKLDSINFNPEVDRLFAEGDLVDRGPESDEVVEWLSKSWFHSIMGNHEQMCIDYVKGYGETLEMIENGGAWFIALTPAERRYYTDAFSILPTLIEIETPNGDVGLVHAECPYRKWSDLKDQLNIENIRYMVANQCMWLRNRIDSRNEQLVEGIHAVVVGHTVVKQVTVLGNVHYIDTGSGLSGDITIYDAHTLKAVHG